MTLRGRSEEMNGALGYDVKCDAKRRVEELVKERGTRIALTTRKVSKYDLAFRDETLASYEYEACMNLLVRFLKFSDAVDKTHLAWTPDCG